ncbi:membrane dipeptidase-domain-containing protein [Camillea tinctor]|nr:membrane dipeptidase-domain-containing protein [Camillea tinctor]
MAEKATSPVVDSKISPPPHPHSQNRRPFGKIVAAALLCFVFFLAHKHYPRSQDSSPFYPKSIDGRVRRILSQTPLIDGHNDLAIFIRYMYNNHIYEENFTKPFEEGKLPMHTDLYRLRKGLNGGAFWSVYTPCPENGTDFSDENYAASVQLTLQQIDLMTRLQSAYPSDFSGIVDSQSAVAAFRAGKLISPLGIEGLHQIGNSVANLRRYHALGVRYATLTHNCGNAFADAALWEGPVRKAPPYWGGVSPKGRRLVNEMNRIGMLVDLSHTSVDTMVDVLGGSEDWAGSKAPVIFSHSSAYALCPHPRNVPDHVLQLVKKTNSVVMVNFAPDFISCHAPSSPNGLPTFDPSRSTLAHVADHIEHIGSLIGYAHVGVGSDFDGIPTTPAGLDDVAAYPELVAELLRRGVGDADAAGVAGGNVLRVWAEAERVAARMQAEGEPVMEDDLVSLRGWEEDFGMPGT